MFIHPSDEVAARRTLTWLQAAEFSGPVRVLQDTWIVYLEHLLTEGAQEPAAFDRWRAKGKFLLKGLHDLLEGLPPGAFLQDFPWLGQISAKHFSKLVPDLYQASATAMIEQATEKGRLLNCWGAKALGLLREIISQITPTRRSEVIQLLTDTQRALAGLPRDNLHADVVEDLEANPGRAALSSVKYVAELYEQRGKRVLELLWGLMHLAGWFKGSQAPDDAHEHVEKRVEIHFPHLAVALPRLNWRRWRNAASHKNGLELGFDDAGDYVLIRDKNRSGHEYCYKFSPEGIILEVALAVELFEHEGAYKTAIDIMVLESVFDTVDEGRLRVLLERVLLRFGGIGGIVESISDR